MTTSRRWASLLAGLSLVVTVLAGPVAAQEPVRSADLAITGFQGEWSPPSAIAASASALTTVGVDGVLIAPDGRTVGAPSADARRQLTATHNADLQGELLVSNFSAQLDDFSEPTAYRLLSSRTNIGAVVDGLVGSVVDQGWDGVSIDLEALRDRDRAGLTTFTRALDDALPPGKTLTICVSLSDSAAGYRQAGYDLAKLAGIVDRVILMAYDQHGPWEDVPGPIGALPWQQAGLDALLSAVPAGQVDLGVAGYGYAWGSRSAYSVSDAQARAMVAGDGATARWNGRVGEWTATLSDRTILWWSDARSFAARVDVAAAADLHGLAVWELGLSDPIQPPWTANERTVQ